MDAFPQMQTKTLSVRVRDKHAPVLRQWAFDCNQVWNAANEASAALSWVPIPEVGWMNLGTSAFDLQKDLKGIREEKSLNIGSTTFQEVIAAHYKARRQFKKNKLKWRCSGGPRRALGWVPFKKGAAVWRSGQVKFNGHFFKVWDSYGLSQYEFRAGNFSEDSRGRWYFNVVVEVPTTKTVQTSAIGVDLGLKDYATCSDGTKLEASKPYRQLEEKLAVAQRAGNKKQVRNIHARIKNRRKDAIHKFTHKLTREHGMIVIGNVSSSKLAKTKMAKSVLDAGWAMLKAQLKYKAIGRGVVYSEVNEAYSTQTCSCCGSIPDSSPKGRASLGVRSWVCSCCGAQHDRDINAALNILRAGLGYQAPMDGIPCLQGRGGIK
jgi:IS605 OrfB family transposase